MKLGIEKYGLETFESVGQLECDFPVENLVVVMLTQRSCA